MGGPSVPPRANPSGTIAFGFRLLSFVIKIIATARELCGSGYYDVQTRHLQGGRLSCPLVLTDGSIA